MRRGGTVSVVGVYGGAVDMLPLCMYELFQAKQDGVFKVLLQP